MEPTPISQGKRRRAPVSRSHEEIYDLVAQANEHAALANKNATDAVSRSDLAHLVGQRVEKKLDDLIKVIGIEGEDERGVRVGTGIVGKVMRLEVSVARRFGLYDGWTKMVIGFTAAAGIAGGIIWWLVEHRLATVLQ